MRSGLLAMVKLAAMERGQECNVVFKPEQAAVHAAQARHFDTRSHFKKVSSDSLLLSDVAQFSRQMGGVSAGGLDESMYRIGREFLMLLKIIWNVLMVYA